MSCDLLLEYIHIPSDFTIVHRPASLVTNKNEFYFSICADFYLLIAIFEAEPPIYLHSQ